MVQAIKRTLKRWRDRGPQSGDKPNSIQRPPSPDRQAAAVSSSCLHDHALPPSRDLPPPPTRPAPFPPVSDVAIAIESSEAVADTPAAHLQTPPRPSQQPSQQDPSPAVTAQSLSPPPPQPLDPFPSRATSPYGSDQDSLHSPVRSGLETSLIESRLTTAQPNLLPAVEESEEEDSDEDEDEAEDDWSMARRKLWVKRSGTSAASATLVSVPDDGLVDDVRDLILHKYANSLGRIFDSPDVALRIIPRDSAGANSLQERVLGPEEEVFKTLDQYYPNGQTIGEALIIDIPRVKTPKPSPRPVNAHQVHYADQRPLEDQDVGYFPPQTTAMNLRPPHIHAQTAGDVPRTETGQVPPLPSPGERLMTARPAMRRQHTSSPISTTSGAYPRSSTRQGTRQATGPNPAQSAVPTPPAGAIENGAGLMAHGATTASPTNLSPRPPPSQRSRRPKKQMNGNGVPDQSKQPPPLTLGGLDGILYADAVPPINVLLVEDNKVNLKLLEMFVKRLKVRWSSAMNGREAVDKWRQGGFHLVLMDIQLPIMSGLEATKEIRRLERINGIGVFARSEGESRPPSPPANNAENGETEKAEDNDRLHGTFKSPVIIVALTASSLQSDRHEALAAGCNDFLTKPVNFAWFERKILEWGCMQALIDFDGWRQWKELNNNVKDKPEKPKKIAKKDMTPEELAAREARKGLLLSK